MATRKVDWKKELADLVATAKTKQEKAALKAFQKALGPHLENPELLRTLLGKIAQSPADVLGVVVAQKEFKSMTAVKKALPKDLKVLKI